MREKLLYALSLVAGVLIVWNLYAIFVTVPDEKLQGAVYRIMFFHIPAAVTAGIACGFALAGSVLYLATRNLKYDALAASVTEVGVTFGLVNLITGMIWARPIWGVWWAWDARLTSMLISLLAYCGYLMLRTAIDDPTTRARICAVMSIFTFPGVIITWKSIQWWRTQHPGPVFQSRGGGGFAPEMLQILMLNMLALILFATVLTVVRLRQVETQRELEGLRREAHAI
jgi:heme exporter protein C